jgi:hypothetical protein
MQSRIIHRALLILLFLPTPLLSGQESPFPNIPGWTLTLEGPVYNSNNLWDIIDGAADLFLEYGFVDLHIGRYIDADSIEVKAELYRHATDIDAFGMYSQERDTSYNFIPMGVQGYLQQGVLNFLTGSYYIKLSTYQTGDKAQHALQTIAQALVDHLKQQNDKPKLFQIFPQGLPNMEQYVAHNFLGYSFLNNAYVVRYIEPSPFKAFLIASVTPEKALATLTYYLNAVPQESITQLSRDAYKIHDPHNGEMRIQVLDRFVFGLVNCPDQNIQDKYLRQLATNLSK